MRSWIRFRHDRGKESDNEKRVLLAVGSLYGGGAERVVCEWADKLSERGYRVAVLVYGRTHDEYSLSDNVTVYSCADTCEEYVRIPYYRRYLYFRRVIKQYKPDYLIPFLSSMRFWMFISTIGLGIRRIETIRINPWVEEESFDCLKRLLNRLAFRTSYRIVIQAQEQREWLSERDREKSFLVRNPLADKYIDVPCRPAGQTVSDFIAVGRLDMQKNYPMMIEGFSHAAKKYPHIRLRIWGEGPKEYKEYLQNLIAENGAEANIRLMGRTSEIAAEYAKSDVFVMTSDYEGSPNALIEAMASRLVCISTDCKTGPKELIDHDQNGFLVSVGSAEGFCEALCKVIGLDASVRNGIADEARNKILSCHSKERGVDVLCEIMS